MPRQCSIAPGKVNYLILLKQAIFEINIGIKQNDAAIKIWVLGATTLLHKDCKSIMPGISFSFTSTDNYGSLQRIEPYIAKCIVDNLQPEDRHVMIIGSDNQELFKAEFGTKNAALLL